MVESKIINENPTIVYLRVSGRISKDEAAFGAEKAMSIISGIIRMNLKSDIIMDMRGYIFDNLNDHHRIWSVELKKQKILKENLERVAITGDDTPKLKAEKEMMKSDILKFFTEFNVAKQWLTQDHLTIQSS
ncbi:hypothetical protein JYT44_03675 [Caldithrix abyssi]|nr:hypothetical protein [Caldithrix abyssi]